MIVLVSIDPDNVVRRYEADRHYLYPTHGGRMLSCGEGAAASIEHFRLHPASTLKFGDAYGSPAIEGAGPCAA